MFNATVRWTVAAGSWMPANLTILPSAELNKSLLLPSLHLAQITKQTTQPGGLFDHLMCKLALIEFRIEAVFCKELLVLAPFYHIALFHYPDTICSLDR